MLDQGKAGTATFLNPVYPHSFPDPFVLKFGGAYFAYATGFAENGKVFPVIRSSDLVRWLEVGGAMQPLENSPPYYWAPEVVYDNGKFYLYYSVGNEILMELRVAVSDRPDGDFVDAGVRLTKEDFAIDAHVFIDDDGTRYLFYATDFLEHSNIGTGTVVDRMIDWFTLEGNPKAVTRAKYDWQVYDPNRKEKGGVRWYTVEGPAVVKRKGKYYEMFSGGNWQNMSYGVSFATSDRLDSEEEWLQFSDGVNTLPILRTIPETVVGPGHNCIVRGPNNRELYCVYHRWTEAGRVVAIDRVDFAGDRLFVTGPTHTPQPLPYSPKIAERFRDQTPRDLRLTGKWTMTDDGAVSDSQGLCEMKLPTVPASFLVELTWAFAEMPGPDAEFGLRLETDDDAITLSVSPSTGVTYASRVNGPKATALPDDFVWTAPHLFRIDVDNVRLSIQFDSLAIAKNVLSSPIRRLTMFGKNQSVLLKAFDLTEGFEELFYDELPLEDNGWTLTGTNQYKVTKGELELKSADPVSLRKGPCLTSLELVGNFRVLDDNEGNGEFGLILFHEDDELLALSIDCARSAVVTKNAGIESRPLPENICLSQHHQLRIVKMNERALCYFDDVRVADLAVELQKTSAGVFANGVRIGVDMIRLTSI